MAATYCPFHTFRSPSVSSVLTMSSTFIEVRVLRINASSHEDLISFKLHVQCVSWKVFMMTYVQ